MSVSQGSVTTLLALALLSPATVGAQSSETPRTPWGVPDLGGVWDFRSLTPLERPEEYGDREFLTEEEALALQQGAVEQNQTADLAPAKRTEAGGSIGAYNRFWMDFGTEVVGTRRTSLIVDPPNGRRPPRTDTGRTRYSTPGSFGSAPLEQIEDLSYFDRCLGTAGLPIYATAYNNNAQIFQTEDHLVMLIEMLNTTRIIPLTDRPHGEVRQWLGDSRGRWEGDTLVVETTNFDRWLHLVGGSREAHLVERFTRVGPDVTEYEYTIEDSTVWTAPWTAIQTLRKNPLPIFENACHEGNYAAGNMLAGARLDEAAAAGRDSAEDERPPGP